MTRATVGAERRAPQTTEPRVLQYRDRLDDALSQIREFAAANPGGKVTLTWRPDGQVHIELSQFVDLR